MVDGRVRRQKTIWEILDAKAEVDLVAIVEVHDSAVTVVVAQVSVVVITEKRKCIQLFVQNVKKTVKFLFVQLTASQSFVKIVSVVRMLVIVEKEVETEVLAVTSMIATHVQALKREALILQRQMMV
jgi:hypothetical protein